MSGWTPPGGTEPPPQPDPQPPPAGAPPAAPPPAPAAGQWGPPQPAWGPPQPAWGPPQGSWGPAPGWQVYAPPPAARPGIIPLRPLGVGELLDGAFTAMRRYPRATLGLSAGVAAVQQLLALVVYLATRTDAVPGNTFSSVGTVSGLVTAVVNAVLSAVLLGMLSLVIGDAVIGRQVSVSDIWRRLRPLVLPLLGAAFLAAVLPFLGLIALIVGGVFLWVALSLTTPALVLERLGVRQALRRSWRLAVPAFWRVLGIRLLALLVAGVIGSIISIPGFLIAFSSLTSGFGGSGTVDIGTGAEIALRITQLVSTTVTAPITAGVLALLYIDRRMRAEALDVTLAQAAQAAQA